MWSERYYYLNLYEDEMLSSDTDTQTLREFISSIPDLEQMSEYEFRNKEGFPFTQLLILKAKNLGNWNGNDVDSKNTNLITIICSKGEHLNFDKVKMVLRKIASFLNWILVDEETNDGIENLIIWKPERK